MVHSNSLLHSQLFLNIIIRKTTNFLYILSLTYMQTNRPRSIFITVFEGDESRGLSTVRL